MDPFIPLAAAGALVGISWAKLHQRKAGSKLEAGRRVYDRKQGWGTVEAINRSPGRYLGGYYTHATVKFDSGSRLEIPADQLRVAGAPKPRAGTCQQPRRVRRSTARSARRPRAGRNITRASVTWRS